MDDIGYWILGSIGIVVGSLASIYLIGCFVPRSHTVARSIALKQTPEAVWQVVTDFANVPSWHADVVKVERQTDRNTHDVWKETYRGNYGLFLETTESSAPTRLVRTITDDGGPFTGRWEFTLAAIDDGEGCRLTLTEHGDIRNPFFRVMFRLYMRPEKYVVAYLTALAKKCGETAAIEQ
jgi:uncharacterized protein YndB with AHSA1/START domain